MMERATAKQPQVIDGSQQLQLPAKRQRGNEMIIVLRHATDAFVTERLYEVADCTFTSVCMSVCTFVYPFP